MKVIEGGRSGRHSTLKDELEAKIAEGGRKDRADPRFFEGWEWWQLSDAEQQVFDIVPSAWPRMMWTWHCYEVFSGSASTAEFTDSLVEDARRQFPQWYDEANRSGHHFLAFAKEFGRLTNKDAFAMQRKQEAADLRGGVCDFDDGS